MAKYSTGSGGSGGDGDACELCGEASSSLRDAQVAGAQLQVCPSCAPHDDAGTKDEKKRQSESTGTDQTESERRREAVQRATSGSESMWDGDTSHWEEGGTDYDDDPLPYLVPDYGDRVVEARQEDGLQREELAEELDVRERDLLAVEQGRATQAGLSGSLIKAIEDRLDVALAESSD